MPTPADHNTAKTILVTGATGRMGGAAARHLLARGFRVHALARHPGHAEAHLLARKGGRIVAGDLDDPASLAAALEGMQGVFSVQDVVEHGFEGELRQGRNLIEAAVEAGVPHVVHVSLAGVGRKADHPLAPSKRAVEEQLRASGVPYTILRPVTLMENFGAAAGEIGAGVLGIPLPPHKRLQMIASDDVGAFAAMAFADPAEWMGRELDVAGAELAMPQVAQVFAEALGREVTYREIDLPALALVNPLLVPMYQWLGEKGFSVDIPALRARFPWLKTFGEWVQAAGWRSASENPMHRPVPRGESPVRL